MLKVLCGVLVAVVGAVLLLQVDDELSPDVRALLGKAPAREVSDAYVYLLGMGASAGQDPRELGRSLLDSIRQSEKAYLQDRTYAHFDALPEHELSQPQGELFCNRREDGCISSLLSLDFGKAGAEIDALYKEHRIMMERYQEFLQLQDYATLTMPTLKEPIPDFAYLIKANRLLLLKALAMSAGGQHKAAFVLLSDHLRALRMQLVNQDNLIGKMVFTFQIADLLDVLYPIAKQNSSENPIGIARLSNKEKAFQRVMAREFAMAQDMVEGLDRNPDIWEIDGMTVGYAPGWSVRAVFKPNMSLNTIFPDYEQVIRYSELNAVEFAQKIENYEAPELSVSRFRNPLGSFLLTIAKPEFLNYVGVVLDLDVKIALFNAAVKVPLTKAESGQQLKDRLAGLHNPYYAAPRPPSWKHERNSLCFDGPLPDNRNMRCLTVQ